MSSLKGINLERNIKITLEYDGTDFCGWQVQPNVRTVQEELEKALQQIFRKKTPVIGAGRTDSGVHARAQVANFRLDSSMPAKKIMAALNGNLPKDVRVLNAEETDPSFHSRFAAKKEFIATTSHARKRRSTVITYGVIKTNSTSKPCDMLHNF